MVRPATAERWSRLLSTVSSFPVLLGVVVWSTLALGIPMTLLGVGETWWTGFAFAAILGLGLAMLVWMATSLLGFVLALVLGAHWARGTVERFVDDR